MKDIKFVYFNTETINAEVLENSLRNLANYVSHIKIKLGLLLVKYHGTAHELYNDLSSIVNENAILIYDLDDSNDAYWGYMNKALWEWIKTNNN